MTEMVLVKRALLSVSDKSGLIDLALALQASDVEILSTGGTAATLRKAGIKIVDVAEHTEFPEIMGGRVKTLHPKIHGGLLGVRSNDEHIDAMELHGIPPIDLLVCNLYPFEETVASRGTYEDCVENIDIGGPAMIRAAAKNHGSVAVLVDPSDYQILLDELKTNNGGTSLSIRQAFAATAYARTAAYDSEIASWFSKELGVVQPNRVTFTGHSPKILRYGENPHQLAAFYQSSNRRFGVGTAQQIQGKELSYNNLNDTDAAFELVSEFDQPAVAIIKHANPCGVAVESGILGAYKKALACDQVSAFGGIIAANEMIDGEAALEMVKVFTEVIIAPDFSAEALDVFSQKKSLRILKTGGTPDASERSMIFKPLSGGLLVQDRDFGQISRPNLKVVTKRQPSPQELEDLTFAFVVAKHVKSNAIVYAKNGATVGVGAGQMSRVDSSRIAAKKAKEAADALGLAETLTLGSVVASDAFFPFSDGLLTAVEAGATSVIQPGGSIRDDEIIAVADDNDIAMIMTGMRHFRH